MKSTQELNDHALALYKELEQKYGLFAMGARNHPARRYAFVRGMKADPEKLPTRQARLSYPPPQVCKDFGRANIPQHPVFYAGDSPSVIIDELSLSESDWFVLAAFYTRVPTSFSYLLLLHDAFSGSWAKIREELRAHIQSLEGMPAPPEKIWQQIQEASLLFRSDQREKTSAIAHHWLYQQHVDAVLYPSVRNDDFCNFAIHPKFVDEHLKFYCANLCKVSGHNVELHQTGQPEADGSIVWSSTTRQDYHEFSNAYSMLVT